MSLLATPMYNATKHAINNFIRSLAPREAKLGIGVAALASGVVKTPLWTEHAEMMKAVGGSDACVPPEEVTEVMVALVEKDETGSVAGDLDQGRKIAIRAGVSWKSVKSKCGMSRLSTILVLAIGPVIQ
jgi:3-hydroxybutyrate dehydrogenase